MRMMIIQKLYKSLEALSNKQIPFIAYDKFISSLEEKGFIYDRENCMLANLAPNNPAYTNKLKP